VLEQCCKSFQAAGPAKLNPPLSKLSKPNCLFQFWNLAAQALLLHIGGHYNRSRLNTLRLRRDQKPQFAPELSICPVVVVRRDRKPYICRYNFDAIFVFSSAVGTMSPQNLVGSLWLDHTSLHRKVIKPTSQ